MARELRDEGKDAPEEATEPLFDIGQEHETEGTFVYDETALNLAAEFKKDPEGRRALKRIAQQAWDDFESGWNAQEKYRQMMANTWSLFSGLLQDKPPPFQNMSNAHVPLLLENTIRMTFRQAYELFGNWTQVFGVSPIGPDDEDTAKLLTLHGNWQIRKRIKDFKRQVGHRGLLIFDLFGDVTCHSYWDPDRRTNRHEILTANEFVCGNSHVSTMPDYSDVPWLAKVIWLAPHELRKKEGQWEDIATTLKQLPPEWDDDSEISQEMREVVDKVTGVDQSEYRKGQYRVIHYEGWLNLPGQKKDRYCQVIFDHQTKTVLKLGIHERVDPYDKRRFEFQQQEVQQYQQQTQERQQLIQQKQQTIQSAVDMAHAHDPSTDLPSQGILMARSIAEQPDPPEPPMPDWMQGNPAAQPEPPETKPIHMFAHGVNIEPVMGVLGMGTGRIHADQNKASNIALQCFIDQATLGNLKVFLTQDGVRLPQPFVIEPGKIYEVKGSTDLQKDVVPLEFGQANPQLLNLVEMLGEMGNRVSNTPEVLGGEAGKSGETAQGLSSRIEQATKMLSVPTGKYADFLTQILENNAALNAVFLDEVEFFSVNNHDPKLGQLGQQNHQIARQLYDRPYDVEISADLKFTSTAQRISEADALVQLPQAVPELAGNFAFKHAVLVKSFEARNRYDLIALLGQPPEPPQIFGIPTSPPAPPPGAPQPQPGAQPGAGGPPGGEAKPQNGGAKPGGAPTASGQQQRGTPQQQQAPQQPQPQ